MSLEKYKGIIPAFYACYDDEGNISKERTIALTEFLIEKGVKGLYVGGSSGECIYHSVQDRKETLEAVMEAAKGKITIIAHVACNNTKDSCELARHAESLGVDAIATIPPIYFRLPEKAIAKYWNDISAAAPNTDYIIYNIPQLAGVALTPSLFDEMLKNPKVVGVKNSSMPIQDIQMFVRQAKMRGRDIVVFNGPDEQFVGGRLIGAEGGIGGTYGVMPEVYIKLDELIKKGEFEKARELQDAANEVTYTMCSAKGNMYAVAKAVLKKRMGVDLGGDLLRRGMGMHVHRCQIIGIQRREHMHLRCICNGHTLVEDVARHGEIRPQRCIQRAVRQVPAPAKELRRAAALAAFADEDDLPAGLHRLEAVDEALAALVQVDVLGVAARADDDRVRPLRDVHTIEPVHQLAAFLPGSQPVAAGQRQMPALPVADHVDAEPRPHQGRRLRHVLMDGVEGRHAQAAQGIRLALSG